MNESTLANLTLVAVIIVVTALFASIFLVIWRRGAAPTPDHVPIRLGVILLGAIGLACIGGLFFLSRTPDLSESSDQSSGNTKPSGETAFLQAPVPQGVTESVVSSTNEVVKNAATDAGTLGLSGQIVALLGTIAGASVAGIAGLLVGPGRSEQQPPSDGTGNGDGQPGPAAPSIDFLRELAKLRDEGVITDREFDRMKEQLLVDAVQKTSSATQQATQATQSATQAATEPARQVTPGQQDSGQQQDSVSKIPTVPTVAGTQNVPGAEEPPEEENSESPKEEEKSVEDLVEKLNATVEAKEMLRELCVKCAESLQRDRLKRGLEALRRRGEKSGKKIETEDVKRMANSIDAKPLL